MQEKFTMRLRSRHVIAFAMLAFLNAACVDRPAGPDADSGLDTPGDGLGLLEIGMVQAGAGPAPAFAAGLSFRVAGAAAPLDPANIQSLTVLVTAIQVRRVGDEENGEGEGEAGGPWIELELEEPVELDLLALPTEGDSPLVIAAGALAAGDYAGVRLFIGEATMVLSESVSIGQAFTYEAGEPLDVFIPSADQTGLKTDLAFTVADGEEPSAVNLLFDPDATFVNIALTGNGMVILAPVIRAANGDDDNGDEGGA